MRSSHLRLMVPSDTRRRVKWLTAEQCAIMSTTRLREGEPTETRETPEWKAKELKCPHKVIKMSLDENTEVVISKVTIRESLRTGDIEILELGKVIEAPMWKQGGLETEFGVIVLEP